MSNGVDSSNYRHTVVTGARGNTQSLISNDTDKVIYFTREFGEVSFGFLVNRENGKANEKFTAGLITSFVVLPLPKTQLTGTLSASLHV